MPREGAAGWTRAPEVSPPSGEGSPGTDRTDASAEVLKTEGKRGCGVSLERFVEPPSPPCLSANSWSKVRTSSIDAKFRSCSSGVSGSEEVPMHCAGFTVCLKILTLHRKLFV